MLRFAFGIVVLLFATNLAYALNIHEQADDKSKIAFTAKPGEQLIPIFTQNQWVKVANPKDGNVGWVKLSEFKKPPSAKANRQHIATTESKITEDNGPKVYRIVEYSGPDKLKPEQIEQLVAQMQKRQQQMDRYMQMMMQNMWNNLRMFHSMGPWFWNEAPIVPIIIVPEQTDTKQVAQDKPDENNSKGSSIIDKVKEKLTK